MGEEAGAAGNHKYWWGDYKDAIYPPGHPDTKPGGPNVRVFNRSYGIKKGIQYGMQGTSVMALSLMAWPILIAGALFPAAYFVGQSVKLAVTGKAGWNWSEWLWGGIIGLAYGVSV